MLSRPRRSPGNGRQGEEGGAAVELAILLPVFLLLALGIADMAHLAHIKQILSEASREGARYGVRYKTNAAGTQRLAANAFSPSVSSWIQTKYAGLLPEDANLTTTPSGAGYTGTNMGDDLIVRVDATKTWWIVGHLIPGIGNSINVTATTTMQLN